MSTNQDLFSPQTPLASPSPVVSPEAKPPTNGTNTNIQQLKKVDSGVLNDINYLKPDSVIVNLKQKPAYKQASAYKQEDKQFKKNLASYNLLASSKRATAEDTDLTESSLVKAISRLISEEDKLKLDKGIIDNNLKEFSETVKNAKWPKREFSIKDKPSYRDPMGISETPLDSKTFDRLYSMDEFTSTATSPDGKFVAAVTIVGRIAVFNLFVEPTDPACSRFLRDLPTNVLARKSDESADEYGYRVFSMLGQTAEILLDKVKTPHTFKMNFSQDSTTLFVSSVFETVAYDLRYFEDLDREVEPQTIFRDEKGREKRGELKFQYFFKNQFAGSLYTPVDREVLVVGCTNDIRFVIFCLDNFRKGEKRFLPPFKDIPYTQKAYSQVFFGRESEKDKEKGKTPKVTDEYTIVAKLMEEDTEVEERVMSVAHNNSNILVLERNTKRKKKIEFYNMEFDVNNVKGKVTISFKADMPPHIIPFTKTLQPSGHEMFVYNTKKSEIQLMKVITTKVNKTVEKKVEFDLVFKLTGKRKNLKHLAVKGDGKYLLIVDNTNWAEVFIKTVKGYTLIHSFDATIFKKQVSTKGELEIIKGLTEQDLSDMDFIEDGSGIININGISICHQRLNLPSQLPAWSIFSQTHFFNFNMQKRLNGSYSVWQSLKDVRYQKIIDFDPSTNGGCIVRTFKDNSNHNLESIITALGNLYLGVHKETPKAVKESVECNFVSLRDQLTSFLLGDEFADEVMVVHIAAKKEVLFMMKKRNKIYIFDRDEIYDYMADSSDPDKMSAFPKHKGEYDINFTDTSFDVKQLHTCCMTTDAKATHIIVPHSDNYTEQGVILAEGTPKINTNGFHFPIDNNRVLVSQVGELANEEDQKPTGVLTLYNLNTNDIIGGPIILDHQDFFTFMVDTPNPNVKALIGENLMGLFDISTNKLVYQDRIFRTDEEVAKSIEFDAHCFLQSPDKTQILISSFNNCSCVAIYSFEEKKPIRKRIPVLVTKERTDLVNRWCFSGDSKYILVVENERIVIFSVAQFSIVTRIQLDSEITKQGKILSISLYNESTELEIAIGHKNNVFFKRIPFYPKASDLMFADLAKKMVEYERKSNDNDKVENAQQLNEIMISMPKYQRYLDTTYLKLLCMSDDSRLIKSYFEGLKDTKEVIFSSAFSKLVTAHDEMKKNAVSCFIELLEYTVHTDEEMPPIDTNILLSWLKSNEMKENDVRKLMNLITFKPTSRSIHGEFKDEFISIVSLPADNDVKKVDIVRHTQDKIFLADSANKTSYDLYKTALKFDLSIGSQFSLDYFRWMKKITDHDLKTKFKPIIYYKWSKIYWYASVYSVIFWTLNALVCAFNAYSYDNWGIAIPIIVLSSLFLGYEAKCISADPTEVVYDPWTYVDVILHLFIISCTLAVRIGGDGNPNYRYNWLRLIAFVVTSFRGMTMLRIFSGTRYFITMLFKTFDQMVAFLTVFAYIIFIYWFVCLVRPALVAEGVDESFYTSLQQSLNIAFGNFDAQIDSGIVLTTTIIGNVVLALVLLNYLIAIISKVYEDVAEERDLYDIRMLLDVIIELECFFMWKTKWLASKSADYCIALPKVTVTDAIKDINIVFDEEKKGLENDMRESVKQHEKEIVTVFEIASRDNVAIIKKEIDTVNHILLKILQEPTLRKMYESAKNQGISEDFKKKLERKRKQFEKEALEWKNGEQKKTKGDTEKLQKIEEDYKTRLNKLEQKLDNFRERLKEGDDQSEASELDE